jgi:hypothetical protein
MNEFDHILNWKLLSGSHDFPGADGGTCISEAAIIAAGFKYKKVNSASDCPLCFSPLISAFAILLNDQMSDDLRQELLMPFVTRLAGTADTQEIERQRYEFLIVGLIRDVMSIPLRGWKDDLAAQCEAVRTLEEVRVTVSALALDRALDVAHALALALARTLALDRARDLALDLARNFALDLALDLTLAFALDSVLLEKMFRASVKLLDGALAIGKQADPVEIACVVDRMATAKSARR